MLRLGNVTLSKAAESNISTTSVAGSDISQMDSERIIREPIVEMTTSKPIIIRHDEAEVVRTVREEGVIEKDTMAPRVETHIL